jgi:hypothetical protein
MPNFYCIHCGQHINAGVELAGTNALCPSCATQIIVPPLEHQSPQLGQESSARPGAKRSDPKKKAGLGRLGFFGAFVGSVFLAACVAALTEVRAVGLLVAIPTLIWAGTSRMKNAGKSEAWAILAIIPFVSLFFYIYCFSAPSAHSKNTKRT